MLAPQKIVLVSLVFASISAHASCGGAFCTLNTDLGLQGTWNNPGMRLDIRAEFIDMDQLRHGSSKTKAQGEVGEHDEVRTINRNFLASFDWNINQDWGLTVRVPFVNRAHDHIFNNDNGAGGIDPEAESWHFSDIGDIQALGHYSFYHGSESNAGVRFGLKLPTGSTNKSNGTEVAERTLQPGTGSVDTLLGVYYNQHHGALSWFTQGMWQQSVHEHDNFESGAKLGLDAGLSYAATPRFSLLLQANLLHKFKDSGSNAEPANSGGTSLSISPGVAYKITENAQLYGFVQKPIYQYVNGYQLTSSWSAAAGLSVVF